MMRRFGIAADTLRLSVFSFLMQAICLWYSVWLTNLAGLQALGLSQLVSIAYGFCVTLSCAGLRLAATQLTTRAEAVGERADSAVRFCVAWGFASGSLVALGLIAAAPFVASTVLGDASLAGALRAVSPALPFVAMTTALYGCYTAKGRILLLSVLQGLEQLFRIALVYLWLTIAKPSNSLSVVSVLMIASVAAEVFSFGLACLFLPREPSARHNRQPILAPFLRIVIPSAVSNIACSLLRSIQEAQIPTMLVLWGLSRAEAIALYGTVSGVVYPVLFFPAAILTSLSIVIVPALTKAYVRRNRQRILSLTRRLLRLVIWFSAAVAMFLHTFAEQMAAVLFHDGSYGAAIALFVPLIPLAYLDLIVDSVLRSIDRQILATICAVADASLSLVLVWLLVPRYGVAGLAASVLSAKLLNLSLSLLQLENGLSLHLRPLRTAVVPFFLAKLCAVFASSVPVGEISDAAELFLRGVLFAAPFLAGFWLTGRRDPSEQQKPKARRGRFFTKQKKSLGKRSQGSSCVT